MHNQISESRKNSGFTLLEIMIVVAIIGLVATMGYPAFIRFRARTQQSLCNNSLRIIEGGKERHLIEMPTAPSGLGDLVPTYIKRTPSCPSDGIYSLNAADVTPSCNVSGHHL